MNRGVSEAQITYQKGKKRVLQSRTGQKEGEWRWKRTQGIEQPAPIMRKEKKNNADDINDNKLQLLALLKTYYVAGTRPSTLDSLA